MKHISSNVIVDSTAATPILSFDNVSIGLTSEQQCSPIVDSVSLSINAGEMLGLVGESGSGKTLLSRAVLQLLPMGLGVSHGRIFFKGQDLQQLTMSSMRGIRGLGVGMVFQEPLTSLNPALKIGFQMAEGLRLHTALSRDDIRRRCIDMLQRVRIKNPAAALNQYPHEFSGGMRQRIMLASTLLLKPALLIADEPTTALDVIIQKDVMDIMVELAQELNMAVLMITHDLSLVAEYADKVAVMERGLLVEQGDVKDVLSRPKHRYTTKLLDALPGRHHVLDQLSTKDGDCKNDILLKATNIKLHYSQRKAFWEKENITKALDGVSVDVKKGETVAVVGESGSGKTTLGRALLRLSDIQEGCICFNGEEITHANKSTLRALRDDMQLIFQDPFSSLDPRMSIGDLVHEALRSNTLLSKKEKEQRVADILQEVGLSIDYLGRFPHELSGGQRQRVAIARALVRRPKFVVADEPVSALDVTVQLQVLKLLKRLQGKLKFSCLFISHDLSVVDQVADRILVMYHGKVVEQGTRDAIFSSPKHPYTIELLKALPNLEKNADNCFSAKKRLFPLVPPPAGYCYEGWNNTLGSSSKEDKKSYFIEVEKSHFVSCYALA